MFSRFASTLRFYADLAEVTVEGLALAVVVLVGLAVFIVAGVLYFNAVGL